MSLFALLFDANPTWLQQPCKNAMPATWNVAMSYSLCYHNLQDALFQEGDQSDGRRSRNLRIVAYDVKTLKSKAQVSASKLCTQSLGCTGPLVHVL